MSESDKQVIQYAIDEIDDIIRSSEQVDATELHQRLYNDDYFIVGTYRAKQFLNKVDGGAFDAIGKVQDYEKDNFGEVNTDLSDPEKVANMYAYIVGEDVLNNCDTLQREWDKGELSEDDLIAIKQELQEQM